MLLLCSQQLGLSLHRPGCRSSRPHPLRWQPKARMKAAPLPIEQIITDSLNRHALRLQKLLPSTEPRLLRLQEAPADDWRLVLDALAPFVKEKKLRSLQDILGRRRVTLHILIENVSDPHNAQAALCRLQHHALAAVAPCTRNCHPVSARPAQSLLRTAEALGVQHVHIVESVCPFQLPAAEVHTATACARGCSPVCAGPSPRVFEAAAPCMVSGERHQSRQRRHR